MGRPCSVCTHPRRNEYEADRISGKLSQEKASKKYGIPLRNIKRHDAHAHLAQKIAKARDTRDVWDARRLIKEIETIMARLRRYADAVDEQLRDPKDPKKYFLGPHDWDIEVVYGVEVEEGEKVRMVTEKALLSELLRRVPNLYQVRIKHADPRDLFLKQSEAMRAQLELIARMQGRVKDIVVNLTVNQAWLRMKAVIWQATEKHPSVRKDIVRRLERLTVEEDESDQE